MEVAAWLPYRATAYELSRFTLRSPAALKDIMTPERIDPVETLGPASRFDNDTRVGDNRRRRSPAIPQLMDAGAAGRAPHSAREPCASYGRLRKVAHATIHPVDAKGRAVYSTA